MRFFLCVYSFMTLQCGYGFECLITLIAVKWSLLGVDCLVYFKMTLWKYFIAMGTLVHFVFFCPSVVDLKSLCTKLELESCSVASGRSRNTELFFFQNFSLSSLVGNGKSYMLT